MLCKCHWIVLYTVHFTAFCLGGPFFPGHGVVTVTQRNVANSTKCNWIFTVRVCYFSHNVYCTTRVRYSGWERSNVRLRLGVNWHRSHRRWKNLFHWWCWSWSCIHWRRWCLHATRVKWRRSESRGTRGTDRRCVQRRRQTRPYHHPQYRTVHSTVHVTSPVVASTSRTHTPVIFTTTTPRSPYLTLPVRSTR